MHQNSILYTGVILIKSTPYSRCLAPPWLKRVVNVTLHLVSKDHEAASQLSFPSANLECVVERGDSFARVEWRKDGKSLVAAHNRGTSRNKYVMQCPFTDDDENNVTFAHMLTVRNVDENDEGEYECLLYSQYIAEPEDTGKLFLKVLRESGI